MDRSVSFPRSGLAGLATLLMASVLGLALLATPTPVAGTLCQPTLSVTTLVDYDPGSLRSAIAQVCTGGTITFAVNGTMHLTSASSPLVINRDMTISGPGADQLAIDAGTAMPIFQINGGQVNLSGLTLQNGAGPSGGAVTISAGTTAITDTVIMSSTATSGGGGIYNAGTLTLTNVTLRNNHETGGGGGALRNDGVATLVNVQILNNQTTASGGGLSSTGFISLEGVVVQGNMASRGGGISNMGPASAGNVSVVGNTAGLGGGGIENSGSLTLADSAVISNSVNAGDGGGIDNNAGTLTLTNVTISGNAYVAANRPARVLSVPMGIQHGGGIDTFNGGNVSLTNVTLANNTAASGAGVYLWDGTLVLTNTIVADNGGGNCSGTISSGGHNLDSADACLFRASGDLTTTNPFLGPLANNGGPTLTHALPRGSPAIDHGTNIGCPGTDQRGMRRPFDGDYDSNALCDIGAFEYNVPMLFLPLVLK